MRLLVFGGGYSGMAIAAAAAAAGMAVTVASRRAVAVPPGVAWVGFGAAAEAVAAADLLVSTVPPGAEGDPVLALWGEAVERGGARWLGYLSTTGVYGDRQGGWVDEDSAPAPGQARSVRRLEAELAWRQVAGGRALDLMRLAGIYGPGRSALDDVRAGTARRVIRPGHMFGRIHRDDIAGGAVAAMQRPPLGTRVLNFADDVPAESSAVVEEAARLLGVAAPAAIAFAEAEAAMSEMGRSFWAESRLVASAKTQAMLERTWCYPSYFEGLAGIFAEEEGRVLS